MAGSGYTTFQLVHATASGSVPTTDDLTVAGELGVNPEDRYLWTRNQAGEIVALIDSSNRSNNSGEDDSSHTHTISDITDINTLITDGARPTIITDATTSRTLSTSDEHSKIRFTSGSAISVTVPPYAEGGDYEWAEGMMIHLEQAGSGQITVAGGSGVTVGSSRSLVSAAQYSVLALMYNGSNVWTLVGDQE